MGIASAPPATASHGELALLLAGGVANVACDVAGWPNFPVVLGAGLAWAVLLLRRIRREPGVLRRWGFRTDTLAPAALAVGIFTAAVSAGAWLWASSHGTLPPPSGFWLVLAAYPIWGLAQQFLFNALLLRNLRALLPAPGALGLAAALFAAAHLPDLPVAVLVLPAALVWGAVYLRWPNLWALGVGHGVVGTLTYYLLLARDPLAVLR